MNGTGERPKPDESQLVYGAVVHWITIASCLIALIGPVLILLFTEKNLLHPNQVFSAIYEGKKPDEIWAAAGIAFSAGGFWPLLWNNLFTPDGFALFGVALGCSVTLWALLPTTWVFIRQRDWRYAGVSMFVTGLIALAMSGIVNMAG